MLLMTASAPRRLVLVPAPADRSLDTGPSPAPRRYRLARVRTEPLAPRRAEGRFAHLKRAHD